MTHLVAIQMTSSPNVDENLNSVAKSLSKLNAIGDKLVVLPECFALFGGSDKAQLANAETRGDGPIQARLSQLAKQHECYIVSGTMPILADTAGKFTASSFVFDPTGASIAEYQKIHLFDVLVDDSTGSYKESRYTEPGKQVVVVDTPLGRVGMAVCYDVRFPGLFEAMGDIDILVLPAAFTQHTGAAHWHTLLRARAIEKQCFVVAAGQTGVHANGRTTYGHSIIYSPWGDMLAERETAPGLIQARIDVASRKKYKQSMPVQQHNRFRSDFVRSS